MVAGSSPVTLATGHASGDRIRSKNAVAVFDCNLKLQQGWGTHLIFIAEVADISINPDLQVLTYTNRKYLG